MRIRPALCVLLALGISSVPAAAEDPAAEPPAKGAPVKENRLAKERSPYLRQHRLNPVDWYPWGDEAFALAKKLDRPLFLSIGYAACHWCHVMEHESFEDPATAKVLNDHFVCVKVDREERPDVDRVYMNAVHAQRQNGGWPMTVLLLADGRPFFTATYMRPEQLVQLAEGIKKAWDNRRADIESAAARLSEAAQELGTGRRGFPEAEGSDEDLVNLMRTSLAAAFDTQHGGYGTNRKFPPHTELLFFLEDDAQRARPEDREQIRITLDAMERGGLHDHVGGGFHRYCTDREWLLPHFEKMLYDNALLARGYAAAAAVFDEPRYARAAARTFAWLEREMAQPRGGFASSLDADTEGEEGLTYTWTLDELKSALAPADLTLLTALSALRAEGNFHDEATHELTGRNIVYLAKRIEDLAKARKLEPKALFDAYERIMATLQAARESKPQPGLDDKVIVGWNGLLVSAYARAGQLLEVPHYIAQANTLASFLITKCRREDGTLLRFPQGSGPEIPGFCEDYVHTIEGLLDMADVDAEGPWLAAATDLGKRLIAEFQDEQHGGFWTTSRTQHTSLFARAKESFDSPIPSDNGTAARLCLRLAQTSGDAAFRKAADRTLSAFRPTMGFARMANGLVALFRALADRLALEAATTGATRGDVHVRQDVFTVDLFQQHQEAAPGDAVRILVRVTTDDGWHVQASPPEAFAQDVFLQDGAAAALEGVGHSPATPAADGKSAMHVGALEIRAVLRVPKDAVRGPRKIPLRLRLQACNDTGLCKVPLEIAVDVPLRFADTADAPRHPSHFPK